MQQILRFSSRPRPPSIFPTSRNGTSELSKVRCPSDLSVSAAQKGIVPFHGSISSGDHHSNYLTRITTVCGYHC
jgi:hypothetical protein